MPYEDDSRFEQIARKYRDDIARVARENDDALEKMLEKEFNVPPEFMATAVAIWWNGKES